MSEKKYKLFIQAYHKHSLQYGRKGITIKKYYEPVFKEEKIMNKRKYKKNRPSVLVCAVSIMLVLGMMTGCSVPESNSSDTQAGNVLPGEEPEADNPETFEGDLSADAQEVKGIAEKFAAAYFSGDMDTVQSCLTTPYEWDIEAYAGTEVISEFTLKGLNDIGKEEAGSSKVISLEYKNNEQEDVFQYLTLEFVKQESGWKIQFYGMEQ